MKNRSFNVALAVVISLAFVGFLQGTRPVTESPRLLQVNMSSPGGEVVPGQTYEELRDRRFGPNHRLTGDLNLLRRGLPALMTPVVQTEEQRQASIGHRATRRAYHGAPPVIPHVIDEQSSTACLACHEKGILVAGRIASMISHPPYASCPQCHVPALPRLHHLENGWENSFSGLSSPGRGSRVWAGAPPTIPHFTWMRQGCASCHGVTGLPGLRTPHPQRPNCQQCHVSESAREGEQAKIP
jgi:nitrate reductase (cytochrome), electron transfer subunit